jgi:alpha-L-rhamnosidase
MLTKFICNGQNALSAVLADEWYAGNIGLNTTAMVGCEARGLSMQLMCTASEGGTQRMIPVRLKSWRAATGPWLYADIMHGAGYDATLERDGWQLPNYDVHAVGSMSRQVQNMSISPALIRICPLSVGSAHPATHMTSTMTVRCW